MSKPMIRIHDLATDEIVDREMTDAEYAKLLEQQAVEAEYEAAKAEYEAAKAAAEAKLEALGLTPEDLKALGL